MITRILAAVFALTVPALGIPSKEEVFEMSLRNVFEIEGYQVVRIKATELNKSPAWRVFKGEAAGMIQGANDKSISYRKVGQFDGVYFFEREAGEYLFKSSGVEFRYDAKKVSSVNEKTLDRLLAKLLITSKNQISPQVPGK